MIALTHCRPRTQPLSGIKRYNRTSGGYLVEDCVPGILRRFRVRRDLRQDVIHGITRLLVSSSEQLEEVQ